MTADPPDGGPFVYPEPSGFAGCSRICGNRPNWVATNIGPAQTEDQEMNEVKEPGLHVDSSETAPADGSGGESASPGPDAPGQAAGETSGDTESSNGWQSRFATSGVNPSAFLAQLQAMIDTVAAQSLPMIREIGAKAAELAAAAADQAGPLAQRAATATLSVGSRVAVRSRDVAADLRRAAEESGGQSEQDSNTGTADSGGGESQEPKGSEPAV